MNKKLVVPCFVLGAAVSWSIYRYLKLRQQRYLRFRLKANREIFIVNSTEDWDRIYPRLQKSCQVIKALGFDCEWVFWGARLPVSLIQLATHDGLCVLVRVFLLTDGVPLTLRHILADKSILKVGVAAKDDGKKLMKDYGIEVQGCVDLRHALSRVRGFKCPNQSLQGLAKGILGISMSKDPSIRCGDWEAPGLSQEQISYAADDALIGIDIFMHIVSAKIFGRERRQQYYGSAIASDEDSFWKTARSLCQGIVDVTYKRVKSHALEEDDDDDDDDREDNNLLTTFVGGRSGKGKASKKAFMARKRPLYYNCCLVAPDGSILTMCDIRKAQWYLDKDLGYKIKEDPMWVKLKFEPAKRSVSDTDYYLQTKNNVCVVCGATEEYVRKLVVPQEYRKYFTAMLKDHSSHQVLLLCIECHLRGGEHEMVLQQRLAHECNAPLGYFPAMLKDHSSHDVLLLCIDCHLRSGEHETVLRQRLAQECNAPLNSGNFSKKMQDQDLMKVVSAAKALLKSRSDIPESRVSQLEDIVKNFYGVTTLTDDLLKKTQSMDYRVKNSKFVPHGKKVVEYYMKKEGGLLEFEKLWRTHFVESMQPKHLPALWSVEHRPERLQPLTEQMRGNLVAEDYM